MGYIPPYINLYKTGELQKRISLLKDILTKCELCPRRCQVNRLEGELGFCRAGAELMISSAFPHFGEEAPLVGSKGSGTIFCTHCNLRCIFCQNYDISHQGNGETISPEQLARYMLALQERGCHNINFVTPTHYLPQIMASLPYGIDLGLHIPLVYNCGGYESVEVIKLLEGVIDIYMPDVKFADRIVAEKYADAPDYPEVVKAVLHEMHRQVGDLTINEWGIAERGLLIRHLVMPQGLAGTRDLMHFIASEISSDSYVNIMNQFRPEYKSCNFPELNRGISLREYREAITYARTEGLSRGFDQE
ncbi:MAG: radical SAM protein [Thermodesulfobacteriota bacterium]|nr:radical SAM protein [Thermodesulfobacteriota bacterium]